MSTFTNIVKTTATVFAGLTLASAASAASYTFDLEAFDSAVNQSGSYADQYNYSDNGVGMSVNGYTFNGSSINAQKVGIFNGFGMGVEQASGSEHALDNNNGVDILTFSFANDMTLDSVTSGWHSGDSDISIYTVSSSGSYTKVENQTNLADDIARSVNSGDIASKIWAVTAYDGSDSNISYGNDFLKLSFLSFSDVASVPAPAPATLGLMGAVLAGLGLRKRARKAA